MKKVVFFIFSILITASSYAQAEPANYAVAAKKFKQFYNNGQVDSIFAMFSAELKAALPLDNFRITTGQLKNQLGPLLNADFIKLSNPLAVYRAKFQNKGYLLNLSLNAQNKLTGLLLSLDEEGAQTAADDPALTETPVLVKTLGGSVSGTLTIPSTVSGKIPVVLIIASAGATDRNGNNPKMGITANSYKLLANDLGKNGIATLRYDKRLVGESVSNITESQHHFEDYVDDAVSLIISLSEDQRFSKIIVFGHNEGSLAGMLAVRDQPVKGFISVNGTSEAAEKLLFEQMKTQPQFKSDAFKTIMDSLRKGKITDRVDPALYYIARPSIQPFIMSWCRYTPRQEIKKVKMPTLIIQGTTDLQVPATEGEKLKKGKSDAALVMIGGMNYVLKEAPADPEQNVATYSKPDLPLKPELVSSIVDFINKIK